MESPQFALGNSLGKFFPDNHCGLSTVCTRAKPRANLGLTFFTVLIQKSEKQWKVLSGCLKNLPLGIPLGYQTFPRGCAPQESLMTLWNSLGQNFPDNDCGLSAVYTTFGAGAVIQLASLVLRSLLLFFTKHQRGVLQSPSRLPDYFLFSLQKSNAIQCRIY